MDPTLGRVRIDGGTALIIKRMRPTDVICISFAESDTYLKIFRLAGLTRNNIRWRRWGGEECKIHGCLVRSHQESVCAILWPGPSDPDLITSVFGEYLDLCSRECFRDGRLGVVDQSFWKAICGELQHRRGIALRPEVVGAQSGFYAEIETGKRRIELVEVDED